jgi:hypothetical protein
MKVTSCDCFKKIEKMLKEDGKNLEIENIVINQDMKFEQKAPYFYIKSGKEGIKKKEYTSALLAYCPFCGKKIEVSE